MQDVPATDATTITAISLMVGPAKSDPEVTATGSADVLGICHMHVAGALHNSCCCF
jgi:hypothetical protein